MSFGSRFLAVDWGTTNRRVFLIERGAVVETVRDDRGVTAVRDFPGEAAEIRARFGDLPMLLAGMVGANIGWRLAPYVPVPAGIDELRAGLLWLDDRTAIVPGISTLTDGRADVMRGEEVQLLGAVAAGLVPGDSLLVQPGTHCKWVRMAAGRIVDFTTAMTGELFALLKAHGILAGMLDGAVADGSAFRDGLARGGAGDLPAALFEVRASVLLGTRAAEDAASFASGILIGADVAARRDLAGRTVHLLGTGALATLYAIAIEHAGARPITIDSEAAFLAGIHALREHLQ